MNNIAGTLRKMIIVTPVFLSTTIERATVRKKGAEHGSNAGKRK